MKIYTEYPYRLVIKTKNQSVFIRDYRKYPFRTFGGLIMSSAWEFDNSFMFVLILKVSEGWHKLINLLKIESR